MVQYINGYEGRTGTGPRGFVIRARELAERYGKHFLPPASLVEKAEKGELLPQAWTGPKPQEALPTA